MLPARDSDGEPKVVRVAFDPEAIPSIPRPSLPATVLRWSTDSWRMPWSTPAASFSTWSA